MRQVLLAFLVGWLGACAGVGERRLPVRPVFGSDAVLLVPQMERYRDGWLAEAGKRAVDPFLVMGHGNDFMGEWCVWAGVGGGEVPIPVEWLARSEAVSHPGRTVVLVICNPHHHFLHVGGVLYARESVWLVPDSECRSPRVQDGSVGTIWKFVRGG